MQVFVHSKTLEITAAMRQFAERHFQKMLNKGRKVLAVNLFLESVTRKKNDIQSSIARVQIVLPGKDIVVERHSHDLYQAILDVAANATRQVRKTREKHLRSRQHGARDWEVSPV
jgi:ribosomal subunit interface protein